MDKFEIFEIRGGYSYQGQTGHFYGEVRGFEDGRIIGIMNDNGSDIVNPHERKIMFGLKRGNRLAYWKLTPNDHVASLIYILGKMDSEEGFEGRYRGCFGIIGIPNSQLIKGFGSSKPLPELADCFRKISNSEVMDLLSKIDKNRMNSVLKKRALEYIIPRSPNPGHVEIQRFESLSA